MRILISILLFSFAFSQEYCAGDQISQDHQTQEFDVCYPCDTCDPWSLSQYAGDILFLDMSASWCAPCFSAIDFIDELEEYWKDQNSNVKFVTALSDIGNPYSCEQWGIQGTPGSPTIVEDDGRLFDWFHDSNGQYPSYVLIDHEMRVRAKPSNMLSNGNNNSCDGEGMEGDCLNTLITNLLDECGDGCSSGTCSDDSACNSGDNTDCIYPAENHDCCGVCTAEVDCLGVCGGSATEEDCSESSNNCPTCTIVCHPDDFECVGDFTNIQDAIEFTAEGDTILVEQGIYYENLVIQKNITLASRAIFDDMSDWVGYSDEYFVNNENINGTILNGSADTNGEGFESVLLIESLDDCIEPLIFGFTITGGEGTIVMVEVDNREGERTQVEQIRGGGFLAVNALPMFKHNAIIQNKGNTTPIHSGGGGDQTSGVDIPTHPDFNWDSPRTECVGDLDLSFNFYKDNDATYGNTLSTKGFEGGIDMSSSFFDVYNCPEEDVATVWVDVEEEVEVDFDNGVGDFCSITDDVWVSPDGDDNNLGTSESEAFKTIQRALEMIAPEENDPVTIFLTEGTFAPSTTGETFPILMISNVNLIGEGEEVTIIDAEQTGGVITMENCENNTISDLTITGGNTEWSGGGMSLSNSNPNLTNLIINGNESSQGGGIRMNTSNPNLTNVIIYNNYAHMLFDYDIFINGEGGGIYLNFSNPTLSNVTISGNYADDHGGGMYLYYSNPTLTHVTISENTAEQGGGISLFESYPTLTNSIIWGNNQESIYINSGTPLNIQIIYSDIEGGWAGEGNIDENPLFVDSDNSDYNLQEDSPCIDSGNPNLWYTDLDGTRSDIGATGGSSIQPNFIVLDFGAVEYNGLGSDELFTIYNYRETVINIISVSFGTTSFSTNTTFPITIEPLETGNINIHSNNDILGMIQDSMILLSEDLPEGVCIQLSSTSIDGNVLSGDLSGTYPLGTYHIIADLTIANEDTVTLVAGTQFLFASELNFIIEGTLKALGNEEDSIIFDRFSTDHWKGFTINHLSFNNTDVSTETKFNYVRVSGAEKDRGGGMFLWHADPTFTNMVISGNTASGNTIYDGGGGMYLRSSNPTLTNMIISGNTANRYGGGMYLYLDSDPTLTNVTIANNTAYDDGGGILLGINSNPILTHVTISNNTAINFGGGMYLSASNPTLTHVTISNNQALRGGGMRLVSSDPILTNVTIANNTASESGGMHGYSSNPTLTNSIIWGNSPESINISSGTPIIIYSDIQDGWEGEGNIDEDPLFTDSENGDYTLQVGSPCIDSGIVIEGIEYCGEAPDMGAYEYGGSSLSGDLNGDYLVNVLDVVMLVDIILNDGEFNTAGDLIEDGMLNVLDIVALVNIILGGG